jgi:zinc transport system substrate-binding protein
VKTRIVLIQARALLASLLLAATAVGCGGDGEAAGSGGRTQVVAGFYPLAFAAEEIGGGGVEVVNLTPAGAEPHDVELTPRDVERVRSADLVLYVGGGFQPALEEAVGGGDATAVDVLEGMELREEDGGADPHVWLDPVRFAQVVERIGAELGGEAPARQLASQLRALDGEYRAGLADCDRGEVVTAHDAFGYLADRYGLEVISIAGLAPEAEPTPRDLEEVADLVEERGVTTVFVEPLLSPEIGETVAREAGVQTAVLDPLEGLTEEQLAAGENYLSVMRANLEALRAGLGCR